MRMFWAHRTRESDFANSTRLIEAAVDTLLGYTSEFSESLRKMFIMENVKLVQKLKIYNELTPAMYLPHSFKSCQFVSSLPSIHPYTCSH